LLEAQKQQALKANIALRTRLQGLLQAQTQKQCSIGRRGALHPGSLHRLQTGNEQIPHDSLGDFKFQKWYLHSASLGVTKQTQHTDLI
jgi:hypothetical protein